MPRMSKIVKCVDCGDEYPRKLLNQKSRCHYCAMKKELAVFRGLRYKSGPEYEHWKEQIKASIGR